MAHRSQCSSAGDNPLDPNYLPPHYREEYRLAIDALVDADLEGYYGFLQEADVVDFLSRTEIEFIKSTVRAPHQTVQPERRYVAEDVDGSSDTYWPVHSDHDAPGLDLGWPQQFRFAGPTEVTTLVNPSDPEMPSIKEQVRRMIKTAHQVIAVVMDMFTDVDIFADILGAATRGVAVYVLIDELNAHHFVAMVNNCRVNLDEIKSMRVRTVSGSTYFCRTGKTFKGQMMDRFILVDCRAVLSGNYSFMWSFEKIHRCLAHLFLGQLVATFDEEFRILYAHSEPLVVENVLANMPHYSSEPENYYNTEKTHMFNRQYPTMGMEWPERTHMNVGHKMLPFRSESIHSAPEANPSVQGHMNMHATQQYRGDHQFIEHGRPMRGPTEMVGFKRHSYGNLPDFEYMPPQNHPTMRGNQYMDEAVTHGGHFAREPHMYQGPGLQTSYDMYGKFRGQGHHVDQFSDSGYHPEVDEADPTGGYDHVQRYLQSQSAMEEGHAPRNVLPPVQSSLKRHSMGHSYKCQTSPTQPNMPEQKRCFNMNRKPQDVSQKQGLRDWRISSYLSACEDAGELDLAELEGPNTCDEVPCFIQEAPCGPEIRPGNRELNRIPPSRENPMSVQIQNDSFVPVSSLNHPTDLSQINIKTTPASTSESSCTTEDDKAEEIQNKEPKEPNRISEEFLKRKPSRPVQRSSRLRHSLIFSSNLELHTSEEMKDTAGEKDGDEASKLSARVSHILDKRRSGSPFQPFQWSSFAKSATFDNSATESAQPEDELSKASETANVEKVENSPDLQKKSLKSAQQEKDLDQTAVPEGNSKRTESPPNVLQKSSPLIDMNDPDCRLKYFKELAAKRKLAAAKGSQSNPVKATQKFALPEKPGNNDTDNKAGPVFKTPETPLKSKTTAAAAAAMKETYKDPKCGESNKDILQRATDAEKIRFKKKLAQESGSTLNFFQDVIDPALKLVEDAKTVSTVKNQANSSQNQVNSVAFNTALTESGPSHYHTQKETDPSHGVLKESCLPVKLPQTKSPINTTPNKVCLSANDSQTLAQSSLSISSTCSDTLSLDCSSTANIAIVDDHVPSNSDHSPFPANVGSSQNLNETETKENPSQQHILKETQAIIIESEPFQKSTSVNTGSSQLPLALETDCSQQSTALSEDIKPSQQSTASDFSKHPSAVLANSSQQSTSAEMDSSSASVVEFPLLHTAKDIEPSMNPTATDTQPFIKPNASVAASSQLPNATETECPQNSTPSTTDSSQQPTATATDSSQKSIATVTNVFQQHTLTKTDSSKQPAATIADSSQRPAVAEIEASQHPASHATATVTESSQKCIVTGTTTASQQPTATKADSAQLHVATEAAPSQLPAVSEIDTSQQPETLLATETEHSQQYTATITYSSRHPTAAVTDFSQQPPTKEAHISQPPAVKELDSSPQLTGTEADNALQFTVADRDSSQQPTATQTVSSNKSVASETESFQQLAVRETDYFLQPPPTDADSPQKPTKTETESPQPPPTTEPDSTQKPPATVIDSCPQSAPPGTDGSQQPTATGTDPFHHPTAKVTESSLQPTANMVESSQHSIATETDFSQLPTVTKGDLSQHPSAIEADSSQQTASKERGFSQQTPPTETKFSQQPIATEKDSSKETPPTEQNSSLQKAPTERDSIQENLSKERDSSHQSTPVEAATSLQPTATETVSSQQTILIEGNSSQQPTATQTDSYQQTALIDAVASQQVTATERDSSQQTALIDPDSSQQAILKEADSSQQSTAMEMDTSQQPTAMEMDTSQQPTATETVSSQQTSIIEADSSQQSTATETDSSQQATATKTDSSQESTPMETDSSQQVTATETDSSQKTILIEPDSSQQSTTTETDSSQQSTAMETDTFQQPNATETDSSQQSTAMETDTSQQPTTTETDSSQQSTAMETDTSQQPTATETDSSQQSTAMETDTSQQPTTTETDSSQQSTAMETDTFQQPNATETDSSQQSTAMETDTSQQPTTTETDSSQKSTASATDSPQQPIAVKAGSTKQHTVTDDKSQNLSNIGVDTSRHPNETENKSVPSSLVSITKTDNSISQNTVITNVNSEHSQSDTVTPSNCQVGLDQTQAPIKPCETPMVKESSGLTGLDSVELSSTQPQGSPEPCQSLNEINSTQTITQIQSSISSNSTESSCLNDPDPEKTDESQKNEIIKEQPQKNDTSTIAEGHEIEVSTTLDPKEIDKNTQTTPEIENSVSEKYNLTLPRHSENQSSVAESPKSIMSAHQSSTANVILCSNLRDDTKVLLEQISAKNQSRATQSKQTLSSPNVAKEGEVKSADNSLTNYSGRPWSAKATPEEREMLLQKMEKMRKERKVYSRFEAS